MRQGRKEATRMKTLTVDVTASATKPLLIAFRLSSLADIDKGSSTKTLALYVWFAIPPPRALLQMKNLLYFSVLQTFGVSALHQSETLRSRNFVRQKLYSSRQRESVCVVYEEGKILADAKRIAIQQSLNKITGSFPNRPTFLLSSAVRNSGGVFGRGLSRSQMKFQKNCDVRKHIAI